MIDASGHDAWIRMRNWQDGKSTENYRLTSMIGEPADFHAFVREDLPCGWKNRRPVGRRFSWTVCRQFTDREPQGPRGEHWSHTLASGEEVDTFAEAKSQALRALKRLRARHIAEGGDVGYGDAPTGDQIRAWLAGRRKKAA
jgi:hypothetical protein